MDISTNGAAGNSYSGNPVAGTTGMNGGVGGDAGASSANITDTTNTAEAYAGSGGNGQDGGPAAVQGQGGGRAGAGGNGGFANAAADVSAASADGNSATATADGGLGGNGGSGGQPSGLSGVGGNGGAAQAAADASNSAGAAVARAVSTGGAGGTSQLDTTSGGGGYTGNLYAGGSGGVADNTTAEADGTSSASATAIQTGGAGGTGGSGGNGAASTLTNAVSGATTGGVLTLTQEAVGGAAGLGDFQTLDGATGGNAVSDLSVSDSSSHTVNTNVEATGGASGSYFDINTGYTDNGYGGSAEATSDLTTMDTTNYAGYASTNSYAQAIGGEGQTGGNANATADATGNAGIGVQAVAQGGYGGGLAGDAIANAAGTAGTTAIVTATARGGSAVQNSGTGGARAFALAVSGQVTANSATEQENSVTNQNIQASATTAFVQSAIAVSTTSNHGTLSAFDVTDNAVANAAFFPTQASLGTDFGSSDTTLIDMELGGGGFANIAGATVVTSAVDGAVDLSPYSASSDLLLDLRSADLTGTGVTGVELILQGGVNNSIEQIYSFSSGSAAVSFFSDNVLDFGTIGAVSRSVGGELLDAELLVTVANPGAGFYADLQYGIGAAPGIAPPPAGDVFSDVTLDGAAYLWSDAANWSAGVPLDGSSATLSTSGRDDIVALGLDTLVSTGAFTAVDGSQLDINTLVSDSATGLEADSQIAGGSATVAVLLGTITGSGGLYVADGANASIEVVADGEPDEIYQAEDGGRIVLDSLTAGSKFGFVGAGTLALVTPGATTSALINSLAIGDVIELPGSTVSGVSFGAHSLTISTSDGVYDFSNVTFGAGAGGFTAGLDASTGLEAITITSPPPPFIFQDNLPVNEGEPFDGVYFWSNAANWAAGAVPGNGAIVSDTTLSGIDDIYQLSLAALTLSSLLSVIGGNLTLGNILNNDVLTAQGDFTGNATVTVNGVTSGGDAGYYIADGEGGEVIDNVAVNIGDFYADGGGLVEITTAPGAAGLDYNSSFLGYYNGPGTFALSDPGATITASLQGVTRQDVLELPGSLVSAVNFGTSSLTITTDSGTYDFTSVNYDGSVTGYTATFDAATGLEAITFTGAPPAAADIFYGSVNHTDFPTLTGELWSTDSNWESGVPRNGDAVSIEYSGYVDYGGISYPDVSADDIAGLSLSSMAVSTGVEMLIYESLTLGALSIAAGADVNDQAVVRVLASAVNDGTISTDPTEIIFDGALSGNGTIEISAGSNVVFYGSVAATETIDFLSDTGTLTIADPAQFDAQIIGSGVEFVICYLRGTRILTPQGEVNVEALQIGSSVVTYFGGVQRIKWIGRQSYARRFVQHNREQMPVRIEPGALGGDVPARALYVSPGHSMLIDDRLVLAKSLVNGVTITQHDAPEDIHYYQIELETHDCVLAEGAWSETYADSEGMRNKFHNAHSFYALYPDYHAPAEPQLCAPRPLSGAALDEVLRPIVLSASAGEVPGPLRGWVEEIDENAIRGWAQDTELLELPVLLDVMLGEQVVQRVLACDHRHDLAAAGMGQGRCSFVCELPGGIPPERLQAVWVRRAADGAALRYCPALQSRLGLDDAGPQACGQRSARAARRSDARRSDARR